MGLTQILYPSLNVILVNRLQKILFSLRKARYLPKLAIRTDSSPELPLAAADAWKIPMKRVQRDDRICYVSAVALNLGQGLSPSSSLELAHSIAERFCQAGFALSIDEPDELSYDSFDRVDLDSANALCQQQKEAKRQVEADMTVYVEPPGWIYFTLTDRGVATWLQRLVEFADWGDRTPTSLTQSNDWGIVPKSIDSFQILYSHARCCSQLRLGAQRHLIQLYEADSTSSGQILHPQPVPWLTTAQVLQCQHPAERHLISQILEIMDSLSTTQTSPKRLWQRAQALSQAFYRFHAGWQMMGEEKPDRNLAQARLGLTFICRNLLRSLLQQLQIVAPIEL
jgi:hypothetical protein